jgi:hypothetical protein
MKRLHRESCRCINESFSSRRVGVLFRCKLVTSADNPPHLLDSISSLPNVQGRAGAAMQCLACRADNKMLLVNVVRDDSIKEPVIERQIYMCSECRHFARRLAFRRSTMPITLPTISTPPGELQNGRIAAPNAWETAVETVRSKQIDFKETAAAAKTAKWTNAVEKLRRKQAALAEEAAVGSRVKLAEPAPSERSESPPAGNDPTAPPST